MAAAWVVHKYLESTEMNTGKWQFIPMAYGDNYEKVIPFDADSRLIVVDFAFKRDIMLALNNIFSRNIIVIDHHKTHAEACADLDFCVFDMNKSGAGLAWDHFFPRQPRPVVVDYIEDRDLWKFKLPFSHEVNAYIQSFPMELDKYDYLDFKITEEFDHCRNQGAAIERYKKTMVDTMCNNVVFNYGPFSTLQWNEDGLASDDSKIPVVNVSMLYSEVGSRLCELFPNAPFAAYYFDRLSDGIRQWGLRSIGDFDVSEVAKKFGGGGHKNAAGFKESLD